jgi:glycerol-3-phosphate acyltransferase PlsY
LSVIAGLSHQEDGNPGAYNVLAPFGKTIGIPFLLLGLTLAIAGVGWLNRRIWGWRLVVAILATQVLGDLFNVYFGRLVEGGIGIAIAGALLLYLLRADVKTVFKVGATDN